MANRTPVEPAGRADPERIEADEDGAPGAGSACVAAVATGLAAAASTVVAPFLDVVSEDAVAVGDGVVSAAVVFALFSALPAVAAFGAAALRRTALAGGLLAGYGAIALGLTFLDWTLVTDPIDANRLELFRPLSAAALDAGPGSFLLFAGHVLAVVAGLFGWVTVHRAALADGYGSSAYSERAGRAVAVRIGSAMSILLSIAAVLAVVGAFAPPYDSSDAVVLVPVVVDAPWPVAVGSAVIGVAAVVIVAAVLAALSPIVAGGALVGAGSGLLAYAATRLVAGLAADDRIAVGAGAVFGATAGVVLLVGGLAAAPVAFVRDRRALGRTGVRDRATAVGTVRTSRWHSVAGATGIVTGVVLGAGSLLPTLTVPDGNENPAILANRLVLVAGFVLVLVSVPLLFSEFAAATRPVVGLLWVAALMAASGVLESVVLAGDVRGVGVGVGGIAVAVGVVGAVLTGIFVLFAGSAERDDVDTSDGAGVDTGVLVVSLVGAVASGIGVVLPLYRGTDLTAASVTELPWGVQTWGQVLFGVAVVIGAVVASMARPARGAALLAGGAIGTVIYLLGFPLTSARALEASMGAGFVPAVIGAVVLAVAAGLSARRTRP